MTELKLCPFCGEGAEFCDPHCPVDDGFVAIGCLGVGCGASQILMETEAEAIAAWNRRATDRDMDYNPMEVAILGGDPTP